MVSNGRGEKCITNVSHKLRPATAVTARKDKKDVLGLVLLLLELVLQGSTAVTAAPDAGSPLTLLNCWSCSHRNLTTYHAAAFPLTSP